MISYPSKGGKQCPWIAIRLPALLVEGIPQAPMNAEFHSAAARPMDAFGMNRITFTVEEENLICMYHNSDRCRTIAGISAVLQDMDEDMRPLAEQTINKLHNMTDAAFEEAQFNMTLSDTE